MIWLTGMARKPGNDWTRVVVLTNRNEKPGKDGRLALIAGRWLNRWQLEKPATRSNLLPFVVPDIFQRERQLSILLKKKKITFIVNQSFIVLFVIDYLSIQETFDYWKEAERG